MNTETPENIRLVRLPELIELIGLGKTSIGVMVKSGEFPAPLQIGKRAVAWRLADVTAWIASRPSTRASK